MTRMHLSGIWINDKENPSDALRLVKGGDFTPATNTPTVQIETATGVRTVTNGGQRATWTLTATLLTKRQVDWLQAHESRLVWVRDWLGRRILGSWSEVHPPVQYGKWHTVSLTVSETTAGV